MRLCFFVTVLSLTSCLWLTCFLQAVHWTSIASSSSWDLENRHYFMLMAIPIKIPTTLWVLTWHVFLSTWAPFLLRIQSSRHRSGSSLSSVPAFLQILVAKRWTGSLGNPACWHSRCRQTRFCPSRLSKWSRYLSSLTESRFSNQWWWASSPQILVYGRWDDYFITRHNMQNGMRLQ